jgi:glycosyltransferase involved in cell wall biosynthesis
METTSTKGIFISFEGISNTIFDSQVALHVKEMSSHGVNMDILTFETWPKQYSKSYQRLNHAILLSQSRVLLYKGFFVYLPFSVLINSSIVLLRIALLKTKPKFIHARSDYAASACVMTSLLMHIPIIWDCRGDSYAEFKLSFKPKNIIQRIFKFIYLKQILVQKFIAGKICISGIFVSETLYKRNKKFIKNKPYEIIPTSASSSKFFYSKELRIKTREILGFNDKITVILYSGGMTGYQNFGEIVNAVKKILNRNSNYHFLVVTPDIEKSKKIIGDQLDTKHFTIISIPFEEMNGIYNASDVGILLRDKNQINDVASPTKFSEYCLTGLNVIMNDSIVQSYELAKLLNILIDYKDGNFDNVVFNFDEALREQTALKSINILSREANIAKYKRIYHFE